MIKNKIITKSKALRIINERIGEILEDLKRAFLENTEEINNYQEKFEIIEELRALKIRMWDYK